MPKLTRNLSTSLRRCTGCGHRIGHRSEMAIGRFFNAHDRLRTRYYHPDCADREDWAGFKDLVWPTFDWREFTDAEKVYMVSVVPTNETITVDVVNGVKFQRLTGFTCAAMIHDAGHWTVTTQSGRGGSRRYTDCETQADAREVMRRWFERRFRRFIAA